VAALTVLGLRQGLARLPGEVSPWIILLSGGASLLIVYGALLAGLFWRSYKQREGFFHWK
jgi:hypothetical protein